MNEKEYLELERLSEKLLSQKPFIKTEWYVITGAPSSGKTSVINELARRGFKINPDISRNYIEEEMRKGLSKNQVREDQETLQRHIYLKMLESVATLSANDLVFHDFALPDNIAFQKVLGIKISPDIYNSAKLYRYKKIFLFEPLPFISDNVRTEDKLFQIQIDTVLKEVYRELKYNTIRVPVASTNERVAIILQNLK